MDLIKILSEQYTKDELPEMNVGDTVRVLVRVKEGNRERTQAFEGTIILPPSSLSPPSARARSAERSCTTCATAWARRPRSRSACKTDMQKRHLPAGRCLFLLQTKSAFTEYGICDKIRSCRHIGSCRCGAEAAVSREGQEA